MTKAPLRAPDGHDYAHAEFTPRGESTGAAQAGAMLDPANQSLADALNILLKILYAGVALLAIAYVFSGMTRVNEGERGIRLLFGRKVQTDLEPGLRWGPPYPFGEVLRVPTQGVETLELDREFWVRTPPTEPGKPAPTLDQMQAGASNSLKPEHESGSIVTGDGNLVHAKWSVQFRRSDIANYAQNTRREQEGLMVRMAARRGVVRACSEAPIEALLRQSPGQTNSVAVRARDVAQQTLDAANAGIEITQLTMTEVTPPLWVRKDFDKVQTSTTQSQKALETAQTDRTTTLNGAAGDLAGWLIERIDEYELALAQNDQPRADAVLASINRGLLGEPVDTGGVPRRVSGDVTRVVSEAQAYRSESVSRAKREASRFAAKLEQFSSNPLVMVTQEWSTHVGPFVNQPTVQKMMLPPTASGDALVLALNRDPFSLREMERAMKERQARRAMIEQARRQQERRYESTTPTEYNADP